MGVVYSATFENVSVSAAQDLFEFKNVDSAAPYVYTLIHALFISNVGGTADAGDGQEEFLRLTVKTGYSTSGSGGATADVLGVGALGAQNFLCPIVVERNNTTVASTGTAYNLHADGFNSRAGYQCVWTPETRPILAGPIGVIRLESAPADAISLSGTVYFEPVVQG